MPWKLRSSCKKTLVTCTLSRHIDSFLKMADRVQKQATKRRRKWSKGFMKKKTTPAVELIELPATPMPVLSSRKKKLALSMQSSASESGPSTSESADVRWKIDPWYIFHYDIWTPGESICHTRGPFLPIAKNGPQGLFFAMGNGPRVHILEGPFTIWHQQRTPGRSRRLLLHYEHWGPAPYCQDLPMLWLWTRGK